jgi:hypothetical protein
MFNLKDILEMVVFIITIIGSLTSFFLFFKKSLLKEIGFKIDNLDVKNEIKTINNNINNLNKEMVKNNNNFNKEIDTIKNNHIFHINKDIQVLKEDIKELKGQQSIIIELLKSLVEKKN